MAAKPKVKGRKLKVYWADIDSLHDWVVAAPNRPEALAAFGVRQDLFAQGQAGETSDPAAARAARARPLAPLRRPKGSSAAYSPATGAADWSAALAKAAPRAAPAKAKAQAVAPPPKPPPDRRPLDRAKAELSTIEARHRDALDRLAEDRARLDERQAREAADYAEAAANARQALARAQRAWRKAGGD